MKNLREKQKNTLCRSFFKKEFYLPTFSIYSFCWSRCSLKVSRKTNSYSIHLIRIEHFYSMVGVKKVKIVFITFKYLLQTVFGGGFVIIFGGNK